MLARKKHNFYLEFFFESSCQCRLFYQVCVFEPTPLESRGTSKHGLDYWWVNTGQLDLECRVSNLAWNHEGTRLLTAGKVLQVLHFCL